MPRRKRDDKGMLLKKDGSIDKRGMTSKENLKKSGLYQRVIKNKKVYESSDSESEEDEFDVVEVVPKKKVIKEETVEEVKEVEPIKEEPIVGEGEGEGMKERPSTPIVEVKKVEVVPEPIVPKKGKRYKVVKSDSDSDSSDAEETEVVKKKKYKRKIKKYNDDLENLKKEKKKLERRILYNDHLTRISNISRDITLKF